MEVELGRGPRSPVGLVDSAPWPMAEGAEMKDMTVMKDGGL